MEQPLNAGGYLLCGLGTLLLVNWLVDRIVFLGKLRWVLGAPVLVGVAIAFALAGSLTDSGEADVSLVWLLSAILGGAGIVFIFLGARSTGLDMARTDLFSRGASVVSLALPTFASGIVLIAAEPSDTSRWWLTVIGLTVTALVVSALISFASPSPQSARALVSTTGIGLLLLSVLLHGLGAGAAVVWSAAGASVGSAIWAEWGIWRSASENDRGQEHVPPEVV